MKNDRVVIYPHTTKECVIGAIEIRIADIPTFIEENPECNFVVEHRFPLKIFNFKQTDPLKKPTKVIEAARGGGKTTFLIKISSKKKFPILVDSVPKAKFILDLAEQRGYEIPKPIVLSKWTMKSIDDTLINQRVLIDEGDLFAMRLGFEISKNKHETIHQLIESCNALGFDVAAVTLSPYIYFPGKKTPIDDILY